ncbi:MAG TPA: peptidoglycan DD-metalloendopeptidase family protein [Actinomycetota bacterium]|nr:peptidoglycan DD-metalloendopeptidase family protein [Actinomycetota bacterium]
MRVLRGRSRRGAAVAAALLTLLSVALPATAGQSPAELEERAARLRERAARQDARGDTLAVKVASLDAQRAEVESRVRALQTQLDRLDRDIETKKRQLTAAQKRMAVLTSELQDILARLGKRTDVFVDRAVAAYMAGPTAYVEGVLGSDSFNDVLDRYEYYQAALDADSTLIDEIGTLRDGVEERRIEVEERQDEISAAKLALQTDRAAKAVMHEETSAVLAERRQLVAAKRSLLADVRGKEARYREVANQLEREAAEKRAIIAAAGSTASGALPTGGGQLLWPAAGPMTSGYGYRTHPIFGDTRLHTGIDIAAGYGAPVVAADAGAVIYVGVMSGYGNVIVLDHGDGLSTTYNHLSSFLVGSGQSVARGSHIGGVGCTGYCTGPHLHFEVRVNGDPVDPMSYLQ